MNSLVAGTLRGAAVKPLEILAGTEYPDVHGIRVEATLGGAASSTEVEMSVDYAKRRFYTDLIHLNGLRQVVDNIRERF